MGAQNRDLVRSPSGSLILALFPKKRVGDMQIFGRRDFDVFKVAVYQLNRVASEFKYTGIVREFRTVSAVVRGLQAR